MLFTCAHFILQSRLGVPQRSECCFLYFPLILLIFTLCHRLLHTEFDWVLVAQLWLTLCDLMDCSPPGSSVLGIPQARILEWVAISSCLGSSWPRDGTWVSWVFCIGRGDSLPLSHLGIPQILANELININSLSSCYSSVAGNIGKWTSNYNAVLYLLPCNINPHFKNN